MSPGPGATGVDALGAGRLDRRPDDPDFFVAEETTFAGMGVEPCDRNARRRDPKGLAALMCEPDRRHLRIEIRLVDGLAQRRVDRDENRADIVVGQHHRNALRATIVGEDFGVPGIANARACHRFLVDRRGDDAADLAGLGRRDGGDDGVERSLTGNGADDSKRGWRDDLRRLDDLNGPRLRSVPLQVRRYA